MEQEQKISLLYDQKISLLYDNIIENLNNKINSNKINIEKLEELKEQLNNDYNYDYFYDINNVKETLNRYNYVKRLREYKFSNLEILQYCYPNEHIYFFKLKCGNDNPWDNNENMKLWFLWFCKKCNINDNTKVTKQMFCDNYGRTLYGKYNNVKNMCEDLINKTELPLKLNFNKTNCYWDNENNIKKYIEDLVDNLGLNKNNLDDYYNLVTNDFKNNNGCGLIDKYNNSVRELLKKIYPEKEWLPWKFKGGVPDRYFDNDNNIKYYMKIHFIELGFINKDQNINNVKTEDIYSLTYDTINGNLLSKFNHSLYSTMTFVFPDKDLKEWLFKCPPQNFWEQEKNIKKFLEWLFNKLNFEKKTDWYYITSGDYINNRGSPLAYKHLEKNSISELIVHFYPELNINKFIRFKTEMLVCEYIAKYFTNNTFIKIRPDWLKNITGCNLELDYYCKELKLAFEYNGIQHYEYNLHFHNNNIEKFYEQQERDKFKKDRCEKEGVYLIIIPYQYNCYNEEELYEYIYEKIKEWERNTNQEF